MNQSIISGLLVLLLSASMAYGNPNPPDSTKQKLNKRHIIAINGSGYVGLMSNRIGQDSSVNRSLIASGHLEIKLLNKISFPVMFTYRKGQSAFSIPVRQIGLSPRYKNWTFFLGQNNIDLSRESFALQNRNIHGLGLRLDKAKMGLAIFRGRLTLPQLQQDSFSVRNFLSPQVGARFTALRMRLGNEQRTHIYTHILLAKDDSLDLQTTSQNKTVRSANFIPELGVRIRIKKFMVHAQLSPSFYTRNMDLPEIPFEDIPALQQVAQHFPINISTRLNLAARGRMELNLGKLRFRARAVWMDPFFESMGLYFVQDDQFTYTLSGHYATGNQHQSVKEQETPRRLWMLSFSAEKGYQTNNIKNTRAYTTKRDIHAGSFSFWLKGKGKSQAEFSVNGNYRNFIIDLNPGLTLLADSIKFTQLTQGGSINVNYKWSSKKTNHAFSIQYINQQLQDITQAHNIFDLRGINFMYRASFGNWEPELGIQLNQEQLTDVARNRIGITWNQNVDVIKDKVSLQSSTQFLRYQEAVGLSQGSIILRGAMILRITRKQSISLSHQSHILAQTGQSQRESRTNFFYRIRF